MGTDINLHFERRIENKWQKIEIPENLMPHERDYEVFGFLAGIRCHDFEPQFESLGIPPDSCFVDESGTFGQTYAYLDEIIRAPWRKNGLQFRYFPIFCSHVLPRLVKDSPMFSQEEERNIRCVMSFDD